MLCFPAVLRANKPAIDDMLHAGFSPHYSHFNFSVLEKYA